MEGFRRVPLKAGEKKRGVFAQRFFAQRFRHYAIPDSATLSLRCPAGDARQVLDEVRVERLLKERNHFVPDAVALY